MKRTSATCRNREGVAHVLRLATAAALVALTGVATAAELEEVTVTAQKRAENVQSIPFAITAIGADALRGNGVDSLEQIAGKVPGLTVADQSNGRTQINIRGISPGEVRRDNTRAQETVAIYLDEIPLSAILYNPDLEPFDLERVEVLRGPQGTLYGSGSLAGTIRLISKAPVMNRFEALVGAGIESVEDGGTGYSLDGALNVPLVDDKLAARISAYKRDGAGWIDNLSDGPGGGDDVNRNRKWGVRSSVLWRPAEPLSIRATYIHQTIDDSGSNFDDVEARGMQRLVTIGTLSPAQSYSPSGKYEQWRYLPESYDDAIDIGNITAQYELERMQLTSSTSYTDRDLRVFADVSANNIAGGFFASLPGGPINVLGIGIDDGKHMHTFAQELRFSSTGDDPFSWIGGLYYSDTDVDYGQTINVTDPRGITGVPPNPVVQAIYTDYNETPGVLFRAVDALSTQQVAAFGDVSYRFAPSWTATAGVRWFDVDQDFGELLNGRLNGSTLRYSRNTSDNGINPKFLLSYQAADAILLSAQASKGFRLGGPQTYVPTVSTPTLDCPADLARLGNVNFDPNGFGPESLWNYELGMKSSWLDRRLQVNASVFYIDYEDMQITTRLNCGYSFTDNAKGARSRGVELEVEALAADGLTLSFGGSYTDAQLLASLSSGEASKGDRLPFVPKVKLNASLSYVRPLGSALSGYLNLSYQYTGQMDLFFPRSSNLPSASSRSAEAYDTTYLRFGAKSDHWDTALYVDNLFNEYAVTYADSVSPAGPAGWVSDTTTRPRTVGINLRYSY